MSTCPCGSGTDYADCCQPVITGSTPARTAEQLMRARYSAYAMMEMDFLFASTHPDCRDRYDHAGTRAWAEGADWQGLEIIAASGSGDPDTTGEVEFIARFKEKGIPREHHEVAQFRRHETDWYFCDGTMVKARPLSVVKTGRNEPCPCGSGQKFKRCCGR